MTLNMTMITVNVDDLMLDFQNDRRECQRHNAALEDATNCFGFFSLRETVVASRVASGNVDDLLLDTKMIAGTVNDMLCKMPLIAVGASHKEDCGSIKSSFGQCRLIHCMQTREHHPEGLFIMHSSCAEHLYQIVVLGSG